MSRGGSYLRGRGGRALGAALRMPPSMHMKSSSKVIDPTCQAAVFAAATEAVYSSYSWSNQRLHRPPKHCCIACCLMLVVGFSP